jgi:hypothetical protein
MPQRLPPDVESLFTAVDEGTFLPTVLARGPWDERALHGGPPAALFAHAIESLPGDGIDWFVARLTVELERSVPVEPLTLRAEITRPGRKVSLVEVTMTLAETGAVLARARALRIRQSDDVALPHDDTALGPLLAREPAPPGPERGTTLGSTSTDYPGFHNVGTEHRFVRGSWEQLGPVIDWIRMRVPVLPGVALTPLQRVAGAADFANGISRVLSFDTHVFINPDLTIHLFHPPEGEWIGVESATHHGPRGIGLSDSAIYDVDGRVGRSNQSLLLDAR